MKTKIYFGLAMIAIVLATLSACSKKKGCMDKDSTNYDSSAQQDDGSCAYQGKVIYWWKQPFHDSCVANGISNINVYLDNAFVGSLPVSSTVYTSAPNCGSTGSLTVTKNLGGSKSKGVSEYQKYLDGSGATIVTSATSNITFTGNTCTTYELVW